ncbi:unnamed protein product [Mytilus coruscus]|uniref:Uncharacterized protein n=1 Tax=Mytilus coruscus TaxID=42192 RepID=A0A6J8EDS8_MYTCO|nr:unnamed protein product [Mytilus coruscus]
MVLRENERLTKRKGSRGKINKIGATEESDVFRDFKEEVKRELAEIRHNNNIRQVRQPKRGNQDVHNVNNQEMEDNVLIAGYFLCGTSEHFKEGCKNRFKAKEKQDRQNLSIRKMSNFRNGSKCEVDCNLNGKEFRLLWDTGAQISIIPVQWLKEKMNETQIRPLSELMDGELIVRSANGSEIPYEGWVQVNFKLKSKEEKLENSLEVPFLLSSHPDMNKPIKGYNVIEHYMEKHTNVAGILKSAMGIKVNRINTVMNIIKSSNGDICSVRNGKRDIIIPGNSQSVIKGIAHVRDTSNSTSAVFMPAGNFDVPEELRIQESLVRCGNGSTSKINVVVENTSAHDVILPKKVNMGMLQNVKGVFSIPDKDDKTKDTYKQDISKEDINEQLWDQPIDLGPNLALSEKSRIQQLPREECGAFSKDGEVGCAPDLKMKIELADQTPVNRSYTSIPKSTVPRG